MSLKLLELHDFMTMLCLYRNQPEPLSDLVARRGIPSPVPPFIKDFDNRRIVRDHTCRTHR